MVILHGCRHRGLPSATFADDGRLIGSRRSRIYAPAHRVTAGRSRRSPIRTGRRFWECVSALSPPRPGPCPPSARQIDPAAVCWPVSAPLDGETPPPRSGLVRSPDCGRHHDRGFAGAFAARLQCGGDRIMPSHLAVRAGGLSDIAIGRHARSASSANSQRSISRAPLALWTSLAGGWRSPSPACRATFLVDAGWGWVRFPFFLVRGGCGVVAPPSLLCVCAPFFVVFLCLAGVGCFFVFGCGFVVVLVGL